MRGKLFTVVLLLGLTLAGGAPAQADVKWSAPGWYLLGFPDVLLAGPFASEAACDAERANWTAPTPPMCLEFDNDPDS